MFQNVAIIMSVMSLILGQPLHDDVISRESNATRYRNDDNVLKFTTVRPSLESNAPRMIVEVLTKPTELQLVDTGADWLGPKATISRVQLRKKRELISLGAVLAALVTLISALTVKGLHETSILQPRRETLNSPTLDELFGKKSRYTNLMHF